LESISKSLVATNGTRDAVWKLARPYQQTGIKFIEKANYKVLVADDMGLGKTIQAILAVRYAPAKTTSNQ